MLDACMSRDFPKFWSAKFGGLPPRLQLQSTPQGVPSYVSFQQVMGHHMGVCQRITLHNRRSEA